MFGHALIFLICLLVLLFLFPCLHCVSLQLFPFWHAAVFSFIHSFFFFLSFVIFWFWHAVVLFVWACSCFLFVHWYFFLFFPCLCMIAFHCSFFLLGMLLFFICSLSLLLFVVSLFVYDCVSLWFLYFVIFWACCCLSYSSMVHFIYPMERIAFFVLGFSLLGGLLSFLFLCGSFHLPNQMNCILLQSL